MANLRPENLTYTKLKVKPHLQDGLLAVTRGDGKDFAATAASYQSLATKAGAEADRLAAEEGLAAANAEDAALARSGGREGTVITGGVTPGSSRVHSDALPPITPTGGSMEAIQMAAERHGEDASTLKAIALLESGGNPGAKNPNSSAGGLFQFIDGTAKAYGLSNRFDAGQASDAGARLTRDNRAALKEALGRDPTPGELYLAHQQGSGGAIRLLRNPSAKAAGIVGAAAVGLNGGATDMTAGEFASLWTRKGDAAYSRFSGQAAPAFDAQAASDLAANGLPAGSPIDPGSVTAGDPITLSRMSNFTIYGRAYNKAKMENYLGQLDAQASRDVGEVFERFGEDPDILDARLKDLRTVYMREHVIDDVAGDFDLAFERMAAPWRLQSRSNARQRVEQQDRASFFDRTAALETDQARALAALDPSRDDTADALLAQQSRTDRHYAEGVARGIITPGDAAEGRARSRRALAEGFYVRQGEALTDPQDVLTLRDEMRKDFATGKLEGVDARAWATIEADLTRLASAKQTVANGAVREIGKRGDAIAEAISRGLPLDADAVQSFEAQRGTVPGGEAAVAEATAKFDLARLMSGASVAERQEIARKLEADPAAIADGRASFARREADFSEKSAKADPVGYAARRGMVPEGAPIVPGSAPAELAGAFAQRAAALETMQDADPALADVGAFRPDELAQIERFWRTAPPEQISAFTDQFINGLPPNVFRATMEQPEMKRLVAAGASSNDPVRNHEAMRQLDTLATNSGLDEVERLFKSDTVDRLQDWQTVARYSSPEEAADWLKRRNDPAWRQKIKPRMDEGRKKARGMDVAQIVEGLDENWFHDLGAPLDGTTRRALETDFAAIFADRYASTGDESGARTATFERLKSKGWGVTTLLGDDTPPAGGSARQAHRARLAGAEDRGAPRESGGRLMLHPPEKYYPAVNGSHDWMRTEFEAFAKSQGLSMGRLTLIADQKTQEAVDRREPPSYLLSTVDPESGFETAVLDAQGKPQRARFDGEKAVEADRAVRWKAAEDYQARKREHEAIRERLRRDGIPGEAR